MLGVEGEMAGEAVASSGVAAVTPVVDAHPRTRTAIHILNLVLLAAYWLGVTGAVFIVYIFPRRGAALSQLLNAHFAAIVGLPAAALMAFSVVAAYRVTDGRIEFEVFGGLKLKGAAGPVLLWIVCFLAEAVAIKALW